MGGAARVGAYLSEGLQFFFGCHHIKIPGLLVASRWGGHGGAQHLFNLFGLYGAVFKLTHADPMEYLFHTILLLVAP